ncbi:MAG: hypothetical protein IT462_12575 [Planctomycetes bacterium]|nr:hypothetical protein [Planctomycetota bacterium]
MVTSKLSRYLKFGTFTGFGAAALIAAVVFFGGVLAAETPEDNLKSGDKHFEEKSYLKAYEAYEKVLKDKPDHPERFRLKLRMGHSQAQLGNHDKAEKALTELADDKGLTDLERARANYRLGGYFGERPHYYYENSKGERSWDRWIADSTYHDVSRTDAERSKDRLKAAYETFEKEALDKIGNFGAKGPEAVKLADEAFGALVDGAAALSAWQYHYNQIQCNIDYFDKDEQKQTYTYWANDYKDKDGIIAIYDRAAELGKKLKQAAVSLMTQAREFPKEIMDAAGLAQKRGPDMSALSIYRKGCFLVELTEIDDWSVRELIQHPDLQNRKYFDGKYSPLPAFAEVYKDYHDTAYADDAQYFIGYCHQQVGDFDLAEKAYQTLVDDAAFKDSTERSSASAALQAIRAQYLRARTMVDDKEVKADKQVRKWSNDSSWRFRSYAGTERTVFHPREKLGMWVEVRNARKFSLIARTLDIRGLMKDNDFLNAKAAGLSSLGDETIKQHIAQYTGEEVFKQDFETGDDGRHRFTQMQFALPKSLPVGGYIVQLVTDGRGGVAGQVVEQFNPIIVTDTQLIMQTYSATENLALMVDADSGKPLTKPKYTYKRWDYWWDDNKTHWNIDVTRYTGAEDSRMRVPTGGGGWDGYLMYAEAEGRFAFVQTGFDWWQRRGNEEYDTYSTRIYPMTDRPVYRPGDDVHAKIIVRARRNGEWANVADDTFRLLLNNPKGEAKLDQSFKATKFGALEVDYALAKDAALGNWNYTIYSGDRWIGNGRFQVEEYKKPEFEVAVQAPDKPVKLGQAISAKIKADYYFGGPVAEANVSYKVFRRFFRPSVYFQREYDWLFNWNAPTYWGTPDQRFYANDYDELVLDGKGKLDNNGELVIEWSSQKALKDWGEWDHKYTIKAEVTDASRRTINGEGDVKALRRAFFVYLDNKLGYYRPGDKQQVEIRTVTADNKPVQVKGELTISRVTFAKTGEGKIEETKSRIRSVNLETDAYGIAKFTDIVEGFGTYELTFACKDEFGEIIEGSTRIIVKTEKWSPGSYRFNTLELITQRRVYREKEEVGILLASDLPNTHMLLSIMCGKEVIQQSYVAMPAGQQEIVFNVDRRHVPNFHINAMTIRDGELHTNTLEIYVPPVDQFLNVTMTTDKPAYLPRDKGVVTVKVTDNNGKPVVTEFNATVFDRSLTYIMPDTIPNIMKHFYGDLRGYNLNYTNSYNTVVHAAWYDKQSYEKIRWYGAPLGFGVKNWLQWEKYAFDFNNDTSRSDKYRDGFDSKRKLSNGPEGDPGKSEKAEGGLRGKYNEEQGDEEMASSGGAGGTAMRRSRGGGGTKDGGWGGAPGEMAGEAPMADAAMPAPAMELAKKVDSLKEIAHGEGAAVPVVRSDFKDSAFYSHRVVTDADGIAKFEVAFPDNLTEWRIALRGISAKAKVGEAFAAVKVRKNLILRDQAPRFFVENDSVTLSAIVMNSYDEDIDVIAQLQLNPVDTASAADKAAFCKYELFPETPARVEVKIGAKREARIDWRVRMTGAGNFRIRMLALSKLESDATEKNYNCKVRGAEMYAATTAVIRDGEESNTFSVNLPDKLDPAQTNLDLMLSPSVAALAMDALPYLLEYPYGCVEQTMSRFLPAVLVRKTLQDAKISLEEVGKRRAQLAYEGKDPQAAYWYKRNPVFDTGTMNAILDAGIDRLTRFQHADGGWGWWQYGDSDTYMSSYVVYGLATAKAAGINFDHSMIDRAVNFIAGEARKEKNVHRAAYVSFVMAYAGKPDKELLDKVYDRRDDLSNMSRAMMCMAQYLSGDKERARIQLSNLEDYRQEDKEHGTVWWWGGKEYWCWWNDKIETNAFVMQAFTMVDPGNQYLEKHVKWLAQNRKGSIWNSTKDTSHAVSALMAYARASGELEREYSVSVAMDGKTIKTWDVTPNNVFALQGNLRMTGDELTPGKHNFTVTRRGKGKVYFSSYLSYFSKEDRLKASNTNEIAIDRKYYKLTEKVSEVTVKKTLTDGTVADVVEKRLSYDRTALEYGAKLTSGDLIEVELNLTAKNDYDYLAFEDFKPAGCEPVALRSGTGFAGGLCQNVELRDDRVAFFVSYMPQGSARLKYQLRAEIPGTFSALPTQGGSMYVPEIKANSEEWVTTIVDKQ